MYGCSRQKVRRHCPRWDSAASRGTGSFFLEVSSEFAVGIAAMRDTIFLVIGHLGECLVGAARLKPRIPTEALFTTRLHEHFAGAFTEKDVALVAIPIRDAALRLRSAIVERVCDRGEPLPPCGFEQPSHVRSWEVAELIEAERNVLDDEALIALAPRNVELESGDLLDACRLDLRQRQRGTKQRHLEDALCFDGFVGIRGDENQLVAIRHGADLPFNQRRHAESG